MKRWHFKQPFKHWQLPFRRRDYAMLALGVGIVLVGCGIKAFVDAHQVALRPEAKTITSPWISPTVKKWQGTIDTMAQRYNIDPNLVAIIMTMESGGYTKANSGSAIGLMQVTPLTAKDIASKYLKQPRTTYNLWDPTTNIEFGTAYLAHLRTVFGDSTQGPSWNVTVELVAAGYNGGPGAANDLESGKGLEDTQTVVYSRDAYNMWRERFAKDSPTYDRWLERGGSILINEAKQQS